MYTQVTFVHSHVNVRVFESALDVRQEVAHELIGELLDGIQDFPRSVDSIDRFQGHAVSIANRDELLESGEEK